jgi:hypothetical protein
VAGVWRDQDKPSEWQAVASGRGEPPKMVTGHGSHPAQALNDLAKRLLELRGPAGGE